MRNSSDFRMGVLAMRVMVRPPRWPLAIWIKTKETAAYDITAHFAGIPVDRWFVRESW